MTQWRWPWLAKPAGYGSRPLTLEELENRNLLSITVGALGDSITAPYQGTSKGSAGDRSWTELLQTLRSPEDITVYNVANNGATSATLLDQGQPSKVAELVAGGEVHSALLFIGVNDVTVNLDSILAGNPAPLVQTLIPDLTTALGTITRAGPVNLVVANIPDTSGTAFIEERLGSNLASYQRLTGAIALANQQIEAVAASYQVPVLDLFDLSHLTRAPLALGEAEVSRFLAPDGWHPGTVTQGLIANTFLAALNIGYGTDVSGLPLSDQEILTAAGIAHPSGTTYLDVSRFVIGNPAQVSSSQGEGLGQTPTTGSSPLQWAGFGQALHSGTAELPGVIASSSVGNRDTGLPAETSRIRFGNMTAGNHAIGSAAFSVQVRQPAGADANLLDSIFAEADAVFFTDVERM